MRRAPVRWRTPFGRFVAEFRVERLVSALHGRGVMVTRNAVYSWVSGRARPRPEVARAILSVSSGHLRYEDIYGRAARRAPERASDP